MGDSAVRRPVWRHRAHLLLEQRNVSRWAPTSPGRRNWTLHDTGRTRSWRCVRSSPGHLPGEEDLSRPALWPQPSSPSCSRGPSAATPSTTSATERKPSTGTHRGLLPALRPTPSCLASSATKIWAFSAPNPGSAFTRAGGPCRGRLGPDAGGVTVVLVVDEGAMACSRAAIERGKRWIAGGVEHSRANSSGSAAAIAPARSTRTGSGPSTARGTHAPSDTAGRASSPPESERAVGQDLVGAGSPAMWRAMWPS